MPHRSFASSRTGRRRDGRNRRSRHVQLVDAPQVLRVLADGQAPRGLHVGDKKHVGAVFIDLDPLGDVFACDRRRERPERLAELDFQVHHRLHLRRARVAENRSTAECPGTELHASLHEADDFLVGHQRRDTLSQCRAVETAGCVAVLVEELLHLVVRGPRTEVRAAHAVGVFRRRRRRRGR